MKNTKKPDDPLKMNLRLLQQHALEIQALLDWRTVRDFCTQCYGPGRVMKVELEVEGEYNDEGGTNYRVASIEARDAQGREVHFDFSLPFWSCGFFTHDGGSIVKDYRESSFLPQPSDLLSEDDISEIGRLALQEYDPWREEDKVEKERCGYLGWYDLPAGNDYQTLSFDLSKEPRLSSTISLPTSLPPCLPS